MSPSPQNQAPQPQKPNPQEPKRPLAFGAAPTLLWGVSFMFLFFLVQTLVLSFYLTSNNPGSTPEELGKLAQTLTFDGTLLSMNAIATALICSGVIWSVTRGRLQSYAGAYLGFIPFNLRDATRWVLWLGAVLLVSDLLTIASGRPAVPEFMHLAYDTADSKLLLWLALVVAAPVFEELLFRGFLFQGLRQSALGTSGTIILLAALWAAIHTQYDIVGMASVFAIGVVFGFARWQSGSVLLPIALHSAANLVAMLQLTLMRA